MTHETVIEQQVAQQVLAEQPGITAVQQPVSAPAVVVAETMQPQVVVSESRTSIIVAHALAQQIIVALGGSGAAPMTGYALESTLAALKAVAEQARDRLPVSGAASEGTLAQIKNLIDDVEGLLTSVKDNTDPLSTQLVGLLTNTSGLALDMTLQAVKERLPLAPYLDRLKISDRLTAPEYLDDQPGVGGVLTFDFLLGAPDLTWVTSIGGNCRAAFGGDPSASKGVRCDDGTPTPIALSGFSQLKVFAPIGSVVSVYGTRYA